MKVIDNELPSYFDEIKLRILADAHIGDGLFNADRLNAIVDEIKEEDNCYCIVDGDMINNATRNSVSDIYAEQYTPEESIDLLENLLNPIKDKILAITEGNHEERSYRSNGTRILRQVSKLLGIKDKYAYPAFLIFLAFGKNQGRDSRKTVYSIYGKHGGGGARTSGGKINYLARMAQTIDADIYIHAHTHIPAVFKKGFKTVDYRNRKVTHREHLFVNSGAFLDYGGYAEKKDYDPPSKAQPYILLEGRKRTMKGVV
jgi:predicted phosphodiesterase